MSEPRFGIPDDELLELVTVYREGLLTGRTVLVTGAGTGIGKAISVLFARLGARLVLASRSEDKLASTSALLERIGAEHRAIPTNIREPDAVDALFDVLEAADFVPDVLINNAGGQFPRPSSDLSDKGWRAVVDTNLNGTWTMMQRAARLWQRTKTPGAIVNVSRRTGPACGAPHRRGRAAVDHLSATSPSSGRRSDPGELRPARPIGRGHGSPARGRARMAKTNPMMRLERAGHRAGLRLPLGRFGSFHHGRDPRGRRRTPALGRDLADRPPGALPDLARSRRGPPRRKYVHARISSRPDLRTDGSGSGLDPDRRRPRPLLLNG